MSKTSLALQQVMTNWGDLKTVRPSERDFAPYGHSLSYETIDSFLERINAIVTMLDEKGLWASSAEVAIADSPIANALTHVNQLIINAKSNGVNWLLTQGFLDSLNAVRHQIASLGNQLSKIFRELSKALMEKSAQDIEAINAAAEVARRITTLEETIQVDSIKVQEAVKNIESASTSSVSEKSKIETASSEAAAEGTSIKEALRQANILLEESKALKEQAISLDAQLRKDAEETSQIVESTSDLANTAIESVEKALREVRAQGLAGAFQLRSDKLRAERRLWILAFLGAAAVLGLLAVVFVVEFDKITYESLLVHLLRKIGLAAPFIWVGWYSAKQIGMVSKIQQDYEYKAATALAFQSYREEVKLHGDASLSGKLMEQAISTFGENPVRLYEDGSQEPVTPIQAAINDLPPEKIAAVLAAIGEQTVKRKFWPFN